MTKRRITPQNNTIMTLSEFIESKTREISQYNFFIPTLTGNILEISEYAYSRNTITRTAVLTGYVRYKLELTKTNEVIKSTRI